MFLHLVETNPHKCNHRKNKVYIYILDHLGSVLFFKLCVKSFLLLFIKCFFPEIFPRNIYSNPFGNMFGNLIKNTFTQIQHGDTNTNWQHKYNLAIKIQIIKTNTKMQHKFNRATQIAGKKNYSTFKLS